MSVSLRQAIHQDTDDHFYVAQIYRSSKSIIQKKGYLAGGALVGSLATVQITALALSYFSYEGSIRSFIEFRDDEHKDDPVAYRPLGDAGGWLAQPVFLTLIMRSLYDALIKEGDYIRLKDIIKKWIEDNRSTIIANPKFHEELYSKIINQIDAYNSRCAFSKSLASRRLKAIKIYDTCPLASNTQYAEEKMLQDIFKNVKTEIQNQTHLLNFFPRFYQGEKVIWQRGILSTISNQVFGIAIPILLIGYACLSVIGEVGLGKELFFERKDLPATGHFAEWPFNAADTVILAILLHAWYIINEGDFELTRNIYAKQVDLLQDTPGLHNRLCDVANSELQQIANNTTFFRLPLDYEFTKL